MTVTPVRILLILTLLTSLSAATFGATILALGDSITAGTGKGAAAYRHFLDDRLRESGLKYRFIGPNRDSKGLNHAGFSGWNSKRIRDITEKTYRQFPADIVLLHAGHNNFAKDNPVPGVIADTRAIVESILRINPQAQVLLAQVIPAGKLPKYSYIPELNRKLARLAEDLEKQGRPVTLVDQAQGFDWRTDTTADMVHPNAAGARKMAARWFAAIQKVIRAE